MSTVTEPQASRITEFVAKARESGEESRLREDLPGYADIIAPTVFALDGLATLDACIVVTDLLVLPAGADDGSDLVIDDSIVSIFDTYSLSNVEGTWLVSDTTAVDRFEGVVGCG